MFSSNSQYFRDMTGLLWETIMFKTGQPLFAVFLWIVLPLMIATVIGWYIADILDMLFRAG